MQLRSFKLRLVDGHVRVVPMTDGRGCPFSGPGVDLRGEPAEAAFRAAAPLLAALAAIEPGIVVRSVAVDLERPRITASLEPVSPDADPRLRVVRVDEGPALRRLLATSTAVTALLTTSAEEALTRREATAAPRPEPIATLTTAAPGPGPDPMTDTITDADAPAEET